jgi:hypothetical protein
MQKWKDYNQTKTIILQTSFGRHNKLRKYILYHLHFCLLKRKIQNDVFNINTNTYTKQINREETLTNTLKELKMVSLTWMTYPSTFHVHIKWKHF